MSRIIHSLVGYDRCTERLAEELDVPDSVLPRARELAHVPADDPDAVMCYPLGASEAHDLADLLKARIDTERHDYFLEGFAADPVSYEFAADAAFREEPLSVEWSVWIHDDAKSDRVQVIIERKTLDDYASRHGQKNHRAVIACLNNPEMRGRVQEVINRAISDGRALEGALELDDHDLSAILDE